MKGLLSVVLCGINYDKNWPQQLYLETSYFIFLIIDFLFNFLSNILQISFYIKKSCHLNVQHIVIIHIILNISFLDCQELICWSLDAISVLQSVNLNLYVIQINLYFNHSVSASKYDFLSRQKLHIARCVIIVTYSVH